MERESEDALENRQSGDLEEVLLTVGTPDSSKRFWCNAGDANPLAEGEGRGISPPIPCVIDCLPLAHPAVVKLGGAGALVAHEPRDLLHLHVVVLVVLPEHPPAVPELEGGAHGLRDPALDPSDGIRGQMAEVAAELEEQCIGCSSVGREEHSPVEEVIRNRSKNNSN